MEGRMILRACILVAVLSCSFLSGCCSCSSVGRDAPEFKVCNSGRLIQELGWFYADVQDTFFGVDYYYDMDHQFDDVGPY